MGSPSRRPPWSIATAIAFYYQIGEWAPEKHIYVLVTIYLLSFLMVSNIKFFSFKKVELFRRHPFQTLVAAVLLFVVVATAPEIMGFLLMVVYVTSGPISTYHVLPPAGLDGEGGGRKPDPETLQFIDYRAFVVY